MKGGSLLFLVILVIVFYFLMIVPQRRQQKKKAEMMKQLGPGAKVMTASGIYAEVVEIHDDIIVARVAPDVEIEMDARAVTRVVSEGTSYDEDEEAHELGAPDDEDGEYAEESADEEHDEDVDDDADEVSEDHEDEFERKKEG